MTGAINHRAAQPKVDYAAIEQRVGTQLEAQADRSDLTARRDTAKRKYDGLIASFHEDQQHSSFLADLGKVGLGAAVLGGVGAGIGALVGRKVPTALAGLAVGGGLGAAGMVFGLAGESFLNDMFGVDDSGPYYPDTSEFHAAEQSYFDLDRAVDALPNTAMIHPGEAWVRVPEEMAHEYQLDRAVSVGDWVERVVTEQDHDGNGEIRIDAKRANPANELLRSTGGGAFSTSLKDDPTAIQAVRELPLRQLGRFDADGDGSVSRAEISAGLAKPRSVENPFGVTLPQLRRWDSDSSGSLSRTELAEGLVRDAALEYHGDYDITKPDGTVPLTIKGGDYDGASPHPLGSQDPLADSYSA